MNTDRVKDWGSESYRTDTVGDFVPFQHQILKEGNISMIIDAQSSSKVPFLPSSPNLVSAEAMKTCKEKLI